MSIPIGQSAALEAPDFNRKLHLTFTLEYVPGSTQSKIPNPPSGLPGVYSVRFVFCTPGQEEFFANIDVKKITDLGRSPLKLGVPPGGELRVELVDPLNGAAWAKIEFRTNSASEISHADLKINAQDFKDAYQTAYNLVVPQLSWWSYHHDVGIGVAACHIVEDATNSIRLIAGALGKQKIFSLASGKMLPLTPIWRTVFSSYREALNANNVFYQFLCFYKVVEAVGKITHILVNSNLTDIKQNLRDQSAHSLLLMRRFSPDDTVEIDKLVQKIAMLDQELIARMRRGA